MSLQGLVLVRNPYFNEAGYEKQVGTLDGDRNSRPYNESAFLHTCRTSLRLLQSPPPPFAPLIKVGNSGVTPCCSKDNPTPAALCDPLNGRLDLVILAFAPSLYKPAPA